MGKEIVDTIYDLADKLMEGNSFRLLDEGLIKEIVDIGYGFQEPHSMDKLSDLYLELYSHMAQKEDSYGCSRLLRLLGENIDFIQAKDNSWIAKSNSLLAEMKQKKRQPEQARRMKIKVGELFSQQNRSVTDFDYNRLDTVVRYLAIDNYYGKNDYGFALYEKMQAARMGLDYAGPSIQRFQELIASFEKNGYDKDSVITCDQNLKLMDGSHRLALCLYFGVEDVSVHMRQQSSNILYGAQWFQENGFLQEEIEIICDKCIELMERYIVPFTCILWPPVSPYFDEITDTLAKEYELVSCQDFDYSQETFMRMVRGVYHMDDIEEWKVQKKLSYMSAHQPKKIRLIKLFFINADFRFKQQNGNTLSKVGEYIKQIIRSEYKDKVENYFYDIIVHTGDNYKQNEYISKLFRPAFSLRDYLDSIKAFPYAVIKRDAPYQTLDFPDTYAFSKDLDVLVQPENYEKLIRHTVSYLQEQAVDYELRGLEEADNYRIRIELEGYLIFQIDICRSIPGLEKEFICDCIISRNACDGYFETSPENEVCVRINEIIKNPQKKHHWDYLDRNRELISQKILERAFGGMEKIPSEITLRLGLED